MIHSKKLKSLPIYAIVFVFCTVFNSLYVFGNATGASSKKWVGTWSAAPYAAGTNTPPSPYLANNTLRQLIRVSIGGDTLRVKFSNGTGTSAVTINSVNIAVSPDGTKSAINASTIKQLKFNGNASVTMAAGTTATSDAVAFPLTPNMRLAITIYYGQCQTNSSMTHHYGSRSNSYILAGDQTANADFSGATTVERWYTINTVDVWAEASKAAIAIIGNSITDGYGLNGGLHNRWTDVFSQRLLANSATSQLGVLNLGIGGTTVIGSGVSRFQQDILNQSGLRYVVVFYGVNDINGNRTAAEIIGAFQKMIKQAHAQNIRVYGATITPFGGNSYFSAAHEATRGEINKWIRTPGNFDRCIDFDKAIRNPADTTTMLSTYNNDGLHPSVAGYRFLGESVDLNLFTASDTIFPQVVSTGNESFYFEAERFVTATAGTNFNVVQSDLASNGKYITVKTGIQSTAAAPADSSGLITIPFTVSKDTTYTIFGRMNNPTADDDSYWVKIDNGSFVMCNGLGTSGWGWLSLAKPLLTKGNHKLTIGYREDGANLDKICISSSIDEPLSMGGNDPITGIKTVSTTSNGYSLDQHSSNQISFAIPNKSFVSIKLYTLHGSEIAELAGREYASGNHNLNLLNKNLPNGMYIYVLKANNCFLTRKMILQ